ncbi:MAG: thiamine pyrophosphate-binding protein [Promethearchaeota archaeon]
MPRVIDLVADILIDAGIDHAFGLPGGVTQFMMEGCFKKGDKMKTITARHEASAAAMADMYGRITGKPGLLLGQGIWIGSNGAFGIMEAFFAGSPMLIITDVSDWDNMSLKGTYQCGTGDYGCVNLPEIFRSMTKYTTYATSPIDVVYGVQTAIKHAVSGRPGPTCVLTKLSSLGGVIEDPSSLAVPIYPMEGFLNVSPPSISARNAERIAELLISANRPVMICGRGVHVSRAYAEVREIAELVGIPVATSYMGKSSIPEVHDLALGVMGGRGQKLATEMIQKADVILAVGTALAPENTLNCSKEFINVEEQKLIHIDIDPRNAAWTYPATIGVTSDAKIALRTIIDFIKKKNPQIDVQKRIEDLQVIKKAPETEFFMNKFSNSDKLPFEPERVVKEINELIGEDDLVVLDAGNNRIWFCSLFKSKKERQVIAPGGAAGMAWSPNAAIAAQLLHDRGKVVSIVGDGGMLMALYTIETVKALNIPLLFIVFNNASLGNVRDFFSRKSRALAEYPNTNFADIATAIGIDGIRVENLEQLRPALEKGLKAEKPTLIDIVVNRASHLRVRTSL